MEGHFLVPDYYEDFRCKGGACRRTCCDGWGISVTQAEYFRLLGMDCPPDLRRRIDVAFHAPETPSPERFRLITPTWRADCPMRAPDGLCALQCTCRRRSSARDLPPVSARAADGLRAGMLLLRQLRARDRDADGAQRENDLPHRTASL